MSYQTVYRELHQPTAVTHCAEAYFTHAVGKRSGFVAPNLVLVRGTRLEVYSLNYGTTPAAAAVGSSQPPLFSEPPAVVSQCRLELVGSWQCWGVIEDLAVLRGRGNSSQRDSLVLAVRDAKVAVIEWDDELHCLRNGSLHSYEGDPSLRDGCPCGTSGPSSNILSVPPALAADPNGRCAAVLVYGLHLAILPAMEVDYLEQLVQQEGSAAKGSADSASVGNSYLVHLAKVLPPKLSTRNDLSDAWALYDSSARGITFLHGYTEPVLLLLYEQSQTWGGRLRDAKDTCALAAMSINIKTKKHPVIWRVEKLPSDCSKVMAVPRGGVLVLSQNLVLYYSQSGSCVMAINSNAFAGEVPPKLDPPTAPTFAPFPQRTQAEIAAATQAAAEKAATAAVAHAKQWAVNVHPETVAAAAKGAPKAPGMELEADRASGCWLAGNVALLSLKTGQLLLVALKFEGAAASKIQVLVAGSAPVASCAATLTSNLLFLGSAVGDSLLIRHTQDTPLLGSGSVGAAAGAAAFERGGSSVGVAENPSKRRRLASLASFDMGGGLEGHGREGLEGFSLEDEGELFKCALGRAHSSVTPVLLGDGLKQNFKVLDSLMCLGPMRSSLIADLHLRESDVHASLSSSATSSSYRPSPCLIAAVGSDKTGALAIMRRSMVADVITAVPQLGAHGAWTLHYRPEGADEPQPTAGTTDRHHAFLLLSVGGANTMVLDAGGVELAELTEGVGFVRDAPTLAVGEFFGATAAVQVTHRTVRLVQGSSQLLHELSLSRILTDAGHMYAQAVTAAIAAAELAAENASANNAAGLPVLPVCIKYAQARDPYVVLLLSDGTALVLQGHEKQQQLQLLSAALPDLAEAGWQEPDTAAVTAVCLYTDTTGWLASAAGIALEADSNVFAANGVDAADGALAANVNEQDVADLAKQQAAAAEAEDADMADAAASAPAAGEETPAEPQVDNDAAAGAQPQQQGDKEMTAVDSTAEAAEAAAGNTVETKAEQSAAAEQAAASAATDAAALLGAGDPAAAVRGNGSPAASAGAVDDGKPDAERRPEKKAEFVVPGLDAADDAMGGVEGLDAGIAAAEAAGDVLEAATAAEAADHDGAAAAEVTDAVAVAPPAAAPGTEGVTVEQPVQLQAAADLDPPVTQQQQQQQRQRQQQQQRQRQPSRPQTFCAVMRIGGGLQLYALPSMTCVFEDAEAVLGHQTLSLLRPVSPYTEMVPDDELQPSTVTELMMECFAGSSGAALGVPAAVAPLLVMLRQDGTCMAYKAFKPQNPNSHFGFRRLALDQELLAHASPAPAVVDEDDVRAAEKPVPAIGMPLPTAAPCRLVRFDQLATPRLEPPIGPGLKAWGLGGESGSRTQAGGGSVTLPQLRYSGIFICGPHPVWLIASRGGLVAHPMESDVGHVDGFCAFHNQNCPYGYIAASLEGEMKICTLPLQMRLDQPWLSCKLPLRATPHSIASYPELHLLALTTSRLSAPPRPFLPAEPGGDAVAAAAYATAEAASKAAQVEELHELQLLAPPGHLPMSTYTAVFQAIKAAADAAVPAAASGSSSLLAMPSIGASLGAAAGAAAGSSARAAAAVAAAAGWAGLPMWRYSLLPGEQAMTLKHVALCEGGDEKANPVPYIAVGCASTYGEDYPALGRVLIFEVVRDKVFKLQGGSEVKISGRLELQREYPGPVTALESLRGYLITAVGNRLEMHYKQGNALVKVNFIDGLQPASGISLVKDYILLGQSGQSCGFFRYNSAMDPHTRERQQKLEEMSVDTERLDAWAVEFMPNEKKLNFVMADGGGNITVLVYDKQDPESWKGKKLLRKGAAHVGAWISQFQRLKVKVPGDASNRQGLLGCTAHGGVVFLNPLWDLPLYTRLQNLQAELVYGVPHTAGLNPKAFQGRYTRAGPTYGAGFNVMKPLKPEENTMLQGDLLCTFAGLDMRAQAGISEAFGATPDEVLTDLRQLSTATNIL